MRALALPVAFVLAALLSGCPGGEGGEKPRTVDHSALTALLKKYVTDKGLVDYKTWKEKDLPALDAYLGSLEKVDGEDKLEKKARLALWIDAYNAITIRAILEFYPLKSIKEKDSQFGFKVWKDYKKTVAGKERSLDEIENEILRKMGEPRIHFAINCASLGCPVLRAEAYEAEKLDEQLEDQVRRYMADESKLKIDAKAKKVATSRIFDWFGGDFGPTTADRLEWLASHAKDAGTKGALEDKDAKLEFVDWDWALNEKAGS